MPAVVDDELQNHVDSKSWKPRCQWLRVGPGIDFRKFLWKFDGLGDRRFPEFPWKFGVWKGNLWAGGVGGVCQVRRADRAK